MTTVYLPQTELVALAEYLDHLRWSPLAWSIHRDMKNILVAYALPYMHAYRQSLAITLRSAVVTHELALIQHGCGREFVKEHMAD